MKQYTHIKDCWNELLELSETGTLTLEQLNKVLDNFPRWTGYWSYHYVDNNLLEVSNEYFDSTYDDFEIESEEITVNLTQDEINELTGVDF